MARSGELIGIGRYAGIKNTNGSNGNGTRRDLTPQEFKEHFPGMTLRQARDLRRQRVELFPQDKTPYTIFLNRLLALPEVYRLDVARKRMSGIIREGQAIVLKLNQNSNNGHP